MRADHSCHCARRPEHHPPSRSNRVRRRVHDKPATQHRRSPGSRETGASSGGRNPAEQHPIPIHPLGAPWPPRSIQGKMLIAISESRRPRPNSVRYPVNVGLLETDRHIAECKDYIAKQRDRIVRAIEQGRSTEVAEETLEALEASLRAFERQRRLLLDRLNEGER